MIGRFRYAVRRSAPRPRTGSPGAWSVTTVSSSPKSSGGWPQCGQTREDMWCPASRSSTPTSTKRATRIASRAVTGRLPRATFAIVSSSTCSALATGSQAPPARTPSEVPRVVGQLECRRCDETTFLVSWWPQVELCGHDHIHKPQVRRLRFIVAWSVTPRGSYFPKRFSKTFLVEAA